MTISEHPDANIRRAAEAGDRAAQFEVGSYHLKQDDDAVAVGWFRRAAEQGHPAAQNKLGLCYQSGCGVPKDPGLALLWYPSPPFRVGTSRHRGPATVAPPPWPRDRNPRLAVRITCRLDQG
jgi:hypothetical protein